MYTTKTARITLIALCLALVGTVSAFAASPATETAVETPQVEAAPTVDDQANVAEAPLVGPLFQDPAEMIGCPDPGCDDRLDCWSDNYYCPLGEIKTCFGSTGNCDGSCGCS